MDRKVRVWMVVVLVATMFLVQSDVRLQAQEIVPNIEAAGRTDAQPEQDFSYVSELLTISTTLHPSGRGDYSFEQVIRNTGASDILEYTWMFNFSVGKYSNLYAKDNDGPLEIVTKYDNTIFHVTIKFRQPLEWNDTYRFAFNITIEDAAVVSGNTGRAAWTIEYGGSVKQFRHTITLPSNATILTVSPTPTEQGPNFLTWSILDAAAGGKLRIEVRYRLSPLDKAPPFLDLPIDYTGYGFDRAASGILGPNRGLVTSWFDHRYPTYETNTQEITLWTGVSLSDLPHIPCTFGVNCYTGHNGIDFQHDYSQAEQPIYAAASGRVVEICAVPPCTRGAGYGKYVLINHLNGYATLYAHLAEVYSNVRVNTNITERRAIGTMGATGTESIHLHFGLYYDPGTNPKWPQGTEVDPYGWSSMQPDMATLPPHNFPESRYMWKHPLGVQGHISESGGYLVNNSNTAAVSIPSGALEGITLLELLRIPLAGVPPDLFKSLGYSFWLRFIDGHEENTQNLAHQEGFNTPVTFSIRYLKEDIQHLDEDSLVIAWWDESTRTWTALPTVVDVSQSATYVTTTKTGMFDLQGTMRCQTDPGEVDDSAYLARPIPLNGAPAAKSFHLASDEDWFSFQAKPGNYQIYTLDLASGVDTVVYLYDYMGNIVAQDDIAGKGEASRVDIHIGDNNLYHIKTVPNIGSFHGCDATYKFAVAAEFERSDMYLPLVMK